MHRLGSASGFLLLSAFLFAPIPLQAEILTLFSDLGLPNVPPNTVPTWSGAPLTASNDGQSTEVSPPEGFQSWKTVQTADSYTGWGLGFAEPQNLTRFQAGELRFWINASRGEINVEIKNAANVVLVSKSLDDLGWKQGPMKNKWVQLRLPLAGLDLSAVRNPFLFAASRGPITFFVDNVRYVDSTAATIFDVSLRDLATSAPASQINFTVTQLPRQWVRANQYMRLEVDVDAAAWGVQIYTENRSPNASPRFSGPSNSNPAGLIDTVATASRLPLAWSIKASSAAADWPQAAEPNQSADPNSFQWLYMKDQQTPNIPSENTTPFHNGESWVTVRREQGIRFGQGPAEIGAAGPVSALFLEANFTGAHTPRTYKTSTLQVELFYD
jgi:hypothetical protein